MNPVPTQAQMIDVDAIKVVVSRTRKKEGWEAMRDTMADVGLKIPIEVTDRGRRDADGIRYELVKGEGRLLAAVDLGWKKIPAIVVEVTKSEFAGRFLAENMLRKSLPWAEKGRLIREAIKAGLTFEEVARQFHVSELHARKYLRVLDKTAHGLEDEVAAMSMNEAEVFTAMPAKNQTIVIEVAKETGAALREVMQQAKHLTKQHGTEGWTKAELEKTIRRLDDDLERAKKRLKPLRLHHALGPQNLAVLLRQRGFRAALEKTGVNVARFEEVVRS